MRVVWIHPHRDNHNVASLRFNVWPTHEALTRSGNFSHIAINIAEANEYSPDVVVCMAAYDADTLAEAPNFIASDPKVVVFQSDGPECTKEGYEKAAAIVVDSTYLATRVPARYLRKSYYIPDAIEFPAEGIDPKKHTGLPLKLVWMGAGGNFFFAEPIVNELVQRGYDITLVTDKPNNAPEGSPMKIIPWGVSTYLEDIRKFDIGIVPYPENLIVDDPKTYSNFYYKDTNRVVTLQAAGLPTICSPLPSYLKYVDHGKSGLIANTIQDWINCIDFLQTDPVRYNKMAAAGYAQAWGYANRYTVTEEWLKLFEKILGG